MHSPFFGPRPHAIATPGGNAPCAPGALGGFGLADPFGDQPLQTLFRVIPGPARAAAIHHNSNILDGQRGLGNGGCQNDLAHIFLGLRPDGQLLLGKWQVSQKRPQNAIFGQVILQRSFGAANFSLAGQEHQDPTLCIGHGL